MSPRINRIIDRFKRLEISRRNLKRPPFSYYLHNIRIYIIRILLIKIQKKKGLFVSTNLETYGYCNRSCNFCFNAERFPQREKGVMSQDLWKKIIDQLSEINFAGRISPHFYGEPLLDKRLISMMKYTRKKCKSALILITSNGDNLTEDLFLKFIDSGVNEFLITNYEDEENPFFNQLKAKYPGHVELRHYLDFDKTNRAGQLFEEKKIVQTPCLRPTGQLVVNWKGDVLLCCMDYYATQNFGNLEEKDLLEIWHSKEFTKKRILLQKGKREAIDICESCDDSGKLPW